MLLMYGKTTVPENWHVKEENAAIFSRVYVVFEGEVIYVDKANSSVSLKRGYLYCFPTDKAYEMIQNPNNPLRCIYLHIDITPYTISDIIEIKLKNEPLLSQLIKTIELAIIQKQNETEAISLISALCKVLMVYLQQKQMLYTYPIPIMNALRYISEHLSESIFIEDLSKLCGYSTQYFIRLFSQLVGISPHQYLIGYRMKISAKLLLDGNSVSKTADLVGYTEVKNFSRAFKKYFGISPTQYKNYLTPSP